MPSNSISGSQRDCSNVGSSEQRLSASPSERRQQRLNNSKANATSSETTVQRARNLSPRERSTTAPQRSLAASVNSNQALLALFQSITQRLEQLFERLVTNRPDPSPTALSAASNDNTFSTLTALVDDADLTNALQTAESSGPITILAPTNQAFEALPEAVRTNLQDPANQDVLQEILQYHVSAERALPSPQSTAFDSLLPNDRDKVTVAGNAFNPTVTNDGTAIPTAGPAIRAANGSLIIPINQVLIPPGLDLSQLA